MKQHTLSQLIDAGLGLAFYPLSLAEKALSGVKQETASTFESLQRRGEEVDAKLRDSIKPPSLCNKLVSGWIKKSDKQAKIEALSTKIDVLVEQVATLAAKQAAEAKPAAKRRAPRAKATSTTSTKSAAKPRTRKTSTTADKDAQ